MLLGFFFPQQNGPRRFRISNESRKGGIREDKGGNVFSQENVL